MPGFDVIVVDVTPEGFGLERLISAFIVAGEEAVAVVDPGPESSRVRLEEALRGEGLEPDYIVVTHVHLDHAGAAGGLLRTYPKARLVVHPRGSKHLVDPGRLWEASKSVLGPLAEVYAKPTPAPAERVIEAPDGFQLSLSRGSDGVVLEAIHTPGHASHHMSIYARDGGVGVLFTGDSAGVVVRVPPYPPVSLPTTPPPFKPRLYLESVEKMLGRAGRGARVAPTHYGDFYRSSAAEAAVYLPRHAEQVRMWLDTIKEALESGSPTSPEELEAILASVDEGVSMMLAVPELRPVKELFLDSTVAGMARAVASGEW